MNPVEAVDRFVFGTLFRKDINPPGPQEYWTNPAGDKIDFTFTFTANSSITISWKKCNNSQSDLWLTSFNYFEYPYSHLLASMYCLTHNSKVKHIHRSFSVKAC